MTPTPTNEAAKRRRNRGHNDECGEDPIVAIWQRNGDLVRLWATGAARKPPPPASICASHPYPTPLWAILRALRDALVIEMRNLLAQDVVFQQYRPAHSRLKRVLVVRNLQA